MASGTATGNHPDRPRLAPGAVSYTGGSGPMLTGPGSVSRLRSTDSCPEETSSGEPQLRQKRAKSLFRSPHAAHRWSPAKAETPPKPSKIKSTPYRSQRAMADFVPLSSRRDRLDHPAVLRGWRGWPGDAVRDRRGPGGRGPGGRGPGGRGPGGRGPGGRGPGPGRGGRRWTEPDPPAQGAEGAPGEGADSGAGGQAEPERGGQPATGEQAPRAATAAPPLLTAGRRAGPGQHPGRGQGPARRARGQNRVRFAARKASSAAAATGLRASSRPR